MFLHEAKKELDDALSSSYPKELGRVEDDLQRALDTLKRIKTNHMSGLEKIRRTRYNARKIIAYIKRTG